MCSMTLCWTKFKNKCFFCSGKYTAFDSLSCQISTYFWPCDHPPKRGERPMQEWTRVLCHASNQSLTSTSEGLTEACWTPSAYIFSNFTKKDTELPWELLHITIFSSRTIIIIIEIICCNHGNNMLWLFPERNNCSIVFQ